MLYFLRFLFTKLKSHFFVFGDGTQIIGICSFNVLIWGFWREKEGGWVINPIFQLKFLPTSYCLAYCFPNGFSNSSPCQFNFIFMVCDSKSQWPKCHFPSENLPHSSPSYLQCLSLVLYHFAELSHLTQHTCSFKFFYMSKVKCLPLTRCCASPDHSFPRSLARTSTVAFFWY